MSQYVLLDGDVVEATVFKDLLYKNPVENPIHGQIGYMMRSHDDCQFCYDEIERLWKPQGTLSGKRLTPKAPLLSLFEQCVA